MSRAVPTVAPASQFFTELRASLKNAQDVTADLSAAVGQLRLENERLVATAEQLYEALRRAYPYVMDALRENEENTPATAHLVREDLEQSIVPALKAFE